MKIFTFLGALLGSFLLINTVSAQDDGWPKTTTTSGGTVIKLYQWQAESFSDNTLQARAAISIVESGKTDPVFGVAWLKATTITNGQQVQVQSIHISDIKLPQQEDDDKLEDLAVTMEKQAPSWNISFPLSELQSSIELNKKQTDLNNQISNTPPKVLYSNVPSILVQIDGAPKLQHNSDWDVDAVVNTPFAIVKNNDGLFYLYGGKHWYSATSVNGSYAMTTNPPSNLAKIEQAVNEANKDNDAKESDANTIYKIIVSTEPAELIQTKGEPNFAAVQGTGLLYVSNTDNDIFMDVATQQYYVLLSGRWYHSKTLSGQWEYTGADKLPEDFAKIPEGSPKDNVLASVAGTDEAKDAVMDAEVPQTAKVDRKNAKAEIAYDGDPQFEPIDGTDMYYATNTSASVIRWRGRYYAVDNGVWFESRNSAGPWMVATERPYAVALIPPRYPVYYMKYVYIYDVYDDYVYMGYTPGYLNTYVYGPTVVYGTGYYYQPWYGNYYYPRPCTWGYGVAYNPWYGWGLNIGFSTGWFYGNIGFGGGYRSSHWGYGGWWGPRVYRPPYCYTPYRNHGYYGSGWNGLYGYNRGGRNINIVNINRNNNIYRSRQNVITRDNQRGFNNRNGNIGRQNWANNNDRNRGRFNNNNRTNSDQRNAIPGIRNRDNNINNNNDRPVRRFNNGVADGNRNNRQPGNDRAWRNNRPNNSTQPQQNRVERPAQREVQRRDNNRYQNHYNNDGGANREQPQRRVYERRDNNPVGNGGRPRTTPQQQQRPSPPVQRSGGSENRPQRNSVRRDDGGGNRGGSGGGGARPSGGGGGGERSHDNGGGRGRRG